MTTRVLQRVILPTDADFDVMPLYVEGAAGRVGTSTSRTGERQVLTTAGRQRPDQVLGRTSYRVIARTHSSFATYFNAFPASYWRRWTVVEKVRLRVKLSGQASVLVYRSNSRGNTYRVARWDTPESAKGAVEQTFDLPLTTFADGGWYWFDVMAGEKDVRLESAQWETDTDRTDRGTVSIGICTFNRPNDCVDVLHQFAGDEQLLDILDRVYVVDQGTKKVKDEDKLPAAQAVLGDKLELIEQPNLGGSGGFSRAMSESVDAGASDYVLLMDDDVRSETESIIRATTFADLARTPTIVGGHMFSMYEKATMHTIGERVQPWRFFWGPVLEGCEAMDLGESGLRTRPELHRRIDVDFNGWWMCLIPTSVVRKIGLALPVFIKWDDCEYGLRAKAASVPTVSLPGVAVWHVPWTDKDDTLDWQAYFHERNRFVAALMHSQYSHGGRLIRESMMHQVKHLLASQYSVAEMRIKALEDVLSGPDHMHAGLGTVNARVRELRSHFPDARIEKDPAAFPTPRREKLPRKGEQIRVPEGRVPAMAMAALGMVKQLRPVKPMSQAFPEAAVPALDARWWLLAQFDSAVVSAADGSGAAWYHRDPEQFRELLTRSIDIHRRIYAEWNTLVKDYRSNMGKVTGQAEWKLTFAGREMVEQ